MESSVVTENKTVRIGWIGIVLLIGVVMLAIVTLTVEPRTPEIVQVGAETEFLHPKPFVSYQNTPVVISYGSKVQWLPWSWEEKRSYVRSVEVNPDGSEKILSSVEWFDPKNMKRVDLMTEDALEGVWRRHTNYYEKQRKEEEDRVRYRLYGPSDDN